MEVSSIDFSAIKSSFALAEILIAPDLNEAFVLLFIDRISGTPIFLTNKYMVNMLSPDKELLKSYKKTERTVADKKRFYKTYFNIL